MAQNFADMMLNNVKPATWTEDEFRQMSRLALQRFTAWNGDATVMPPEYAAQIAARGYTPADRAVAIRVYTMPAARSTAHIAPVTYANTNGGSTHFTPTTVKLLALSGEAQERANSPIPCRFGESDQFANLQDVGAYCAQLVKNDQGEWKPNISLEAYVKTCQYSEIKIPGLTIIADSVINILKEDKLWKGMTTIQKNAVQGATKILFVREAINRLSPDSYTVLNTIIVCEGFKIFEKQQSGRWSMVLGKNGKPQCDSVYTPAPCSAELRKKIKRTYPDAFWYKSGFCPTVQFPNSLGDVESAKMCVSRSMEIAGSGTSCAVILAGMKGYSGLTDEFGKRICFLLAATLSAWSRGRDVDVQLETTGDAPMIVSSLNKWAKQIKDLKHSEFLQVIEEEKGIVRKPLKCDFSLILPRASDMAKVHVKLQDHVVPMPREGTVVVAFTEGSLPTASSKSTPVDYDASSYSLLPRMYHANDYIIYTTVFGCCPFGFDKKVQSRLTAQLAKIGKWSKDNYVYRFGTSAAWQGVISSLQNVHLAGFGFPVGASGHRVMTEETLHLIKLECVHTQEEWYHGVARDARVQAFAWLYPISRYSPISNLPFLSKAGVTLSLMAVVKEDGELLGNVARVPTHGGTRIIYYDGGEDARPDGVDHEDTTSKRTTTSTALTGALLVDEPELPDNDDEDNDIPLDEDLDAIDPADI